MVKFQGNTAQMRYRSLASYHPRYIHQFPHKSIRVIAKGSAVLPSRKSAEPFSSYKVIPAPATHSRHSTHQNSTNAATAIILLSNRQSSFEKMRVFKALQPFTSTFHHSHSILAGGLVSRPARRGSHAALRSQSLRKSCARRRTGCAPSRRS